jgi:hypothetical protein
MSFLLNKAKQNISVANDLITGAKYYAPVVHCSYYACIQLIIHVLLQNTTEEDLKIKKTGLASHEYYIKEIIKVLDAKDPLTSTKFNKSITQLRSFRIQSDYSNIEIKEAQAKKTQELSLDIKNIFIQRLGVKWN